MRLVCMVCGHEVEADTKGLESFVLGRVWGLKKGNKIHDCGHESVFAEVEPIYVSFVCKKTDKPALLLARYELKKWKGRVNFHFLEEGVRNRQEFKKILKNLLKEIEFILKSKKVTDKQRKIKAILVDKIENYREVIQV